MALRSDELQTKNRILSTCVRLFLENGYYHTTMQQIFKEAQVSSGSFSNLFHGKDGVLMELVKFMFDNRFRMARNVTGTQLPPIYIYAAKTSIQLTLTELNENLREIYPEAYTYPESLAYIQRATARELYRIFGPYQPTLTEEDFYLLDFGSAGLMRGHMANPCNAEFSLEKKLRAFLSLSLGGYKVPEEEIKAIWDFIANADICAVSQMVMEEFFCMLAMQYDFSLAGLLSNEKQRIHTEESKYCK